MVGHEMSAADLAVLAVGIFDLVEDGYIGFALVIRTLVDGHRLKALIGAADWLWAVTAMTIPTKVGLPVTSNSTAPQK